MNKLATMCLMLALVSCGDDDDNGAGPDASTDGGGSGGDGGASGGGGGGKHGSGGRGSTSGTGGKHGGSGSDAGGDAGSSGAGGNGSSGSGGGNNNDDAGMQPTATKCRAPVVAQNPGNACPSADPVALKATLVKDGFDTPVFLTYLPGDADHVIVVERGGHIKRLDLGSGEVSDFLDVSDKSLPAGGNDEFGLLGLAVHPDFPDDPRIFINYVTDPNQSDSDMGWYGHTNVSSYEASVDSADPNSEMVLINYGQPQSNHNGGMLAFGPDGCLFIGAGDGGNSNDQGTGHASGGNGQALDTPLAKILRIDVDDPSSSAPGNMSASNPHIWDYGIRNPWRFSFDRDKGDLYVGDVGQGAVEEVDVEIKGDGNHNYGWPIGEGTKCLGGGDPSGCDLNGLTQPVDDYPHVADHIDCVVGGYVYRGSKIPSLKGWYVYGDNGPDGVISTFVWDGSQRCKDTIVLSTRDDIHLDSDIVSFGEDSSGELYVMSHSGVYHLEPK